MPDIKHILALDKMCRKTVYELQTRDRHAFPSMSLALHEVLRKRPYLWGQAATEVALASVQASVRSAAGGPKPRARPYNRQPNGGGKGQQPGAWQQPQWHRDPKGKGKEDKGKGKHKGEGKDPKGKGKHSKGKEDAKGKHKGKKGKQDHKGYLKHPKGTY